MKEILEIVFNLSVLAFVLSSMIGMGLSLTLTQIITPLKDKVLVAKALLANFIIVPIFVYTMVHILPLSEGEKIGLIIISLAGGAPFLPKLAGIAKSDTAFSIGLMLLLMVTTIFYLPFVLPYLLDGATVNPMDIAKSLVTLMLLPLLLSLWLRAKKEPLATKLVPFFTKLSNIALILLTISLIILNTKNLIAMMGMGMVAIVLLLIASLAIGYFLGGKERSKRVVLSLGTGQRNISAAILVAAQNFGDNPDVTLILVALSIIGLVIMLPLAAKFAKN